MVLTAPHAASALMLELSARLSAAGDLRVLDGGNRFNVYPVARAVRRYTSDLTGALARIRLARAFTCYQMAALLAETPADGLPTLVIDLLATFYDDNAKLTESQRLLADCIPHLDGPCYVDRLTSGGQRCQSSRRFFCSGWVKSANWSGRAGLTDGDVWNILGEDLVWVKQIVGIKSTFDILHNPQLRG